MMNALRRRLALAVPALALSFSLPAHAEFKAEVKYAQVGDIKLAYYTRGQGEPLIMIMGYASTMGARIARQVVIRHPELVNKAIFAAPNPGGSPEQRRGT